jgi:hypothetical protein
MPQAHANPDDGPRPAWRVIGRLSLRARLVLLVIASLVPLIAFNLVNQYLQYRDAIALTHRQTLEFARSLTAAVEQELQARTVALQVLALSPSLQGKVVRERWPAIRILLTSGFRGTPRDRNATAFADIRLLTKPYRRNELARTLRDTLDGPA